MYRFDPTKYQRYTFNVFPARALPAQLFSHCRSPILAALPWNTNFHNWKPNSSLWNRQKRRRREKRVSRIFCLHGKKNSKHYDGLFDEWTDTVRFYEATRFDTFWWMTPQKGAQYSLAALTRPRMRVWWSCNTVPLFLHAINVSEFTYYP